MSFNSIEGIGTSVQLITVDYSGDQVSWDANVNYTDGSGWLNLDKTNGSSFPENIQVSASSLPAGVYKANINVSYSGRTDPIIVPVTYTVSSKLTSSPSQWDITVNGQTAPADLNKDIILSSNAPSGQVLDWAAVSDQAWLTASINSGDTDTNNQIGFAIDANELANLTNDVYSAIVTFSSSIAGVSDIVVSVSLTMDLPQVKYVMPHVALAGLPDTVLLRGTGFAGVTGEAAFDSSPALSITQVNNEVMYAEHDSLTTGAYSVNIANMLGINRAGANLDVVAKTTYLKQDVVSIGYANNIVFDELRNDLYVADYTNEEVERHHFDGTKWVSDSISLLNTRHMTLTPDGNALIIFTFTSDVYHIDLDTFTVVDTVPSPLSQIGGIYGAVMTNSGDALVKAGNIGSQDLYKYNIESKSFTQVATNVTNYAMGVSGDGNRVYFTKGSTTNPSPILYYDSATGTLNTSALSLPVGGISVNRDGTRWIHRLQSIYDNNFVLIGILPNGSYAISEDGTRAYAYQPGGGLPVIPQRIYTYDLTQTDADGKFVQVGDAIDIVTNVEFLLSMVVVKGNAAVIMRGSEGMYVQPLP